MAQDNSKKMAALHASNLRGIVESVNTYGIKKEDIVQVISGDNGFMLLYYK